MTGSVVLDTAVGLAVVFFAMSSICAGLLEWISAKSNQRGEYLLRGLREMLDLPPSTPEAPQSKGDVPAPGQATDLMTRGTRRQALQDLSVQGVTLRSSLSDAHPGTTVRSAGPLADLVLAHPLVAVMHRPAKPGSPGGAMHLASYLSGRTFAASLIDLLVPNGAGNTTIDELADQFAKLDPRVPARAALIAMARNAGDSVTTFRRSLESWYDEQMDRVSGWYKRWAQWRLLIAGLLLAVVLNVDTVRVTHALFHDQPVRNAVVAQAVVASACPPAPGPDRDACLGNQKTVLDDLPLPIGWGLGAVGGDCKAYNRADCAASPRRWLSFLWHSAAGSGVAGISVKVLGWLLTGAAVSLGAPFWFDALGKLGSLRTAGPRPRQT